MSPNAPVTPRREARLLRGAHGALFGLGYDDERVELAHLPRGRVLVIAAAGEIAAALAARGDDVDAIDINPRQLEYARRRVAGAPAVSGAAERLLRVGRAVLAVIYPVWRPRRVERLLRLPADRARRVWRARFVPAPVRLALRAVVGARGLIALLVPGRLRSGIPERLPDRVLADIDVRLGDPANRFLHRLLRGRDHPAWRMPDPSPGSIRWLTGDVLAHLERSPGAYRGISLSNVADAAGGEWLGRLRAAARRALAPGGVAVLRTVSTATEPEARARAGEDRCPLWGAIHVWHAEAVRDDSTGRAGGSPR